MTIGALGESGMVGAYGFGPYVYNTNHVSASSMNKLSRISDNVLDQKIDYNELADDSKNINPLKKGQTLDFQSMLAMQMQRGQNNAARIMKPAKEIRNEVESGQAYESAAARFDDRAIQEEQMAESAAMANAADGNNGRGNINYQMQQALQAYGMFTTV